MIESLFWTAASTSCAETNRTIVLAFHNEGLLDRQPEQAFLRYMAPNFVEHKPDIPKRTRENTAKFLAQIIAEVPEARWEIVRTVADGDMVFLHARFTPASGRPSYALADVFRVKDCKIVEHWDVVGPPPKEQVNPNNRFYVRNPALSSSLAGGAQAVTRTS